jgi:hypothetical protein
MLNKTLEQLIKWDAALTGFSSDDLPMAARLRALNTLTSLERHFADAELAEVAAWAEASGGFDAVTASFGDGECYYVFGDGSLYYKSNGQSEVWAFASDFADQRIINGYDGPLDEMDYGLLAHLGGYFAEVAEERGAR